MDTVIIGAENSHSPGDLFERFPGKYHGAVLSVDHGSGKPRKKALNPSFCLLMIPIAGFCLSWKALRLSLILLAYLGDGEGFDDDPLICRCRNSICSLFLISVPAKAQTDSDCFPWQEMRDGRCVPKGTSAPTRAPSMSAPCVGGTNDAGGQCLCPANTHLDDASGSCLVNAVPAVPQAPQPAVNIVCEGGQLSGSTCSCPAGFRLKPPGDNIAAGGSCVRTDAENCLGGELTVSGTCLCDRHVIMSGEEYALDYVNGKCVPQRCPIAALKKGKCVSTAAKSAGGEDEEKTKLTSPGLVMEEPEQRRRCGHGMIRTHSGCVPARRRYPSFYESRPAGLSGYYLAPDAPLRQKSRE